MSARKLAFVLSLALGLLLTGCELCPMRCGAPKSASSAATDQAACSTSEAEKTAE